MKNDLTTTFLNFVLAMLVFLTVGFGLLTIIWREPELARSIEPARQAQTRLEVIEALANETAAYNATARSPELASSLHALAPKPASR
jgi:hypothetical protein